ncbi:MAG TPA: dihydrolipoamide acetyltransferase family protein, partial [Actinophytocola sp.]|nr:dihydrolipoamide acetyltransferase family protein [Actinophytocola sp.]
MPDYKVFPLPDTAEGLVDAEILTWHIKPGDEVAVNQIIVEIETAKAAVELPCPWAGVVTELHAQPGETVNVGSPIVTIDVDPGGAEAPAASTAAAAEQNGQAMLVGYGPKTATTKRRARKAATADASIATAPPAAPAEPALVEPAPTTVPDSPAALLEPGAVVPLAKPPVRKLAKDLGVDLRGLTGTGDGGVITRADVERAVGTPEPSAGPAPAGARERRVPVKGVRKMTAQAMVESAYSAPHVTEFLTVDVTPMMELRAKLKSHPGFRDVKITPLTFAAKAVCLAAKRTPDVNALWAGEEIVYKDYV